MFQLDIDRLVEANLDWSVRTRTVPSPETTTAEVERRFAAIEKQKAQVFQLIDDRKDEAIRFLQDLVRTQSVNPSANYEKQLADSVASFLRNQGAEVRQIEPFPNRVSNWALVPGSEGRRTLLFDSHLDTVPAGDESAWHHPPFGADIVDGKMFGRGTKDMKFGMAAALLTPKMLKEAGCSLRGNIMITTTADEECGGHAGIYPLLQTGWVQADWCIYTEGLPDRLTIGSKGWCQLEVVMKGKNSHTARKEAGKNAILSMCKVASLLDGIRFPFDRPHPIVPGGTVASLNIIEGGFKENVVPDRCRAIIDVRFSPGIRPDDIVAEFERVLAAAKREDPSLDYELRPVNIARASSISPDEPVVRYVSASIEEVLGRPPTVEGVMATSDARFIWLDAGIPVVHYSMGNMTGHMPDEYVEVDDYIRTLKVYCLSALLLLG